MSMEGWMAGETDVGGVVIAGDLFLGGQAADPDSVVSVESAAFASAALRIVNLESPISDAGTPADKPVLFAFPAARERLRELRVGAVSLANNHAHDMGAQGIVDTLQHLDAVEVKHAGLGLDETAARRAARVLDDLYLLAYCHYSRPTLRYVLLAGLDTPGVAPLNLDKVLCDLDRLPNDSRAIVYFHWGEEHLWLPSPEQVELAKRVLEHPRAALVVGSHAHRPQGYLNHDGKRAYFCLGNFLMPNLVVLPPINSAPDTVSVKPVQSTRRYHRVSRPTLKRWMSVNRLSLLVRFDPATGEVGHRVLVQADARPAVRELSGLPAALVSAWVELLSLLFRVPAPIYRVLHLANLAITRASWKAAIRLWLAKEMGLGRALRKVLGRLMPRAR